MPLSNSTLDRLKLLINSDTPLIALETVEEHRAVGLLQAACRDLNLPLFEWTIADGLQRSVPDTATPPRPTTAQQSASEMAKKIAQAKQALVEAGLPNLDFGSQDPGRSTNPGIPQTILNTREAAQVLAHIESMTVEAVFVLKDFHRHLDDPIVVRRLRDVAQVVNRDRRAVVLTGPSIALPAELEKVVEYLELPLPDVARLRALIDEVFQRMSKTHTFKRTVDDEALDAIAQNLRGLTEDEAERALTQAMVQRYALCPDCVTDVLEAKKETLRRAQMLEFVDAVDDMSTVGGLENLKQWLRRRQGAFDPGAKEFGLEAPRGVVIMGVQGCGKSMSARCIAGEWKLPLVKFDASSVYDKYIGESEKRVQKVFAVAEQLAPVVLWIDEIEKVFAGSGPESASVDAGVSSRILGAFLSWMQDRRAPVFIAATSNNVNVLPPELIRKGRFDEIFFVGLPHAAERRAIFALHLKKRKRDPQQFDLDRLAAASVGYSGAEIEAAVQAGLYAAFGEKKPLTTEHIVGALKDTVPLSSTRAEDIEALREWARQRAVPASAPEPEAAAGGR